MEAAQAPREMWVIAKSTRHIHNATRHIRVVDPALPEWQAHTHRPMRLIDEHSQESLSSGEIECLQTGRRTSPIINA
jgi:hypothetical protein